MELSAELLSQFTKITTDQTKDKKTESFVYGTTVNHDGRTYVKIDGSDLLTPVNTTADTKDGERVTVMIKDHVATITGNMSSPSARSDDVKDAVDTISEFEIVIANKVDVDDFVAEQGRIDSLVTDNVAVKQQLSANNAVIVDLQADNVKIEKQLTANSASIESLKTTKLDAEIAVATYATISDLEATNADIYNLEATYGDFVNLTTDELDALNAKIKVLTSDKIDADQIVGNYATITELNVERGRIDSLEVDVGDVNTLMFGSASGNVLQTAFANAVIAQLGNAQIKSAMIENVSADKITAGDIITNNVRVISEDGKLIISDETIQISDNTRLRVQIGKDGSGDYSINVWDADGNLMFSEGGITDDAIKNAIIRDDMVSDTADISAHKLNIASLFEVINGSDKTINSTRIFLDENNQTLDVAFESMTSDVNEIQNGVSSQGTQIAIMQGQIANKIWQTDIDNATDSLVTNYAVLEQTVDSISATIASHTAELETKADSSDVIEVSDKIAVMEASLSGFQSTVSSTYATKNELSNIEVGARNLLLNTAGDKMVVMSNGGNSIVSTSAVSVGNVAGVTTLTYETTGAEVYFRLMNPSESTNKLYGLEPGKSYTFSGKAQVVTTGGTLLYLSARMQNYNVNRGWYNNVNDEITTTDTIDWVYFDTTFTIDEDATGCYVSVQLYFEGSWSGYIKLKELQLEKGTMATDWSPAPDDYPTVKSVVAAQTSADAAQKSVDTLEVGGRNLLINSKVFKGSNIIGSAVIDTETYKDFAVRSYDATSLTGVYNDMLTFTDLYAEELGSTYTFSFYARGNGGAKLCTYFHGGTDYVRVAKVLQSDGTISTLADGAAYWSLTENWQRYWVTWTLRSEGDISVVRHILFRIWSGATAYICGCKLEKGVKATDWTPSPEDVDANITIVQSIAEAAQAAANQNAIDMANVITNFNNDIENLQTQIDGSITTWFYDVDPSDDNEPAMNWSSSDLKNIHLGDLYYNTISGYCYRYQVKNNIYSWQRITDTDVTKALADAQAAQDTADQKRRVFYAQPTVPYDAGDLWVQGSSGDILRCQTARVTGQSYSESDWIPASKYTDDTAAKAAAQQALEAKQAAESAQKDIDDLSIGGRNLLKNSRGNSVDGWVYGGLTVVEDDVKGHCVQKTNTSSSGEVYIGSSRTNIIEPSAEYTLSLDIWCNEYLRNFDLFWLSDTLDEHKTGAGYVNIRVKSIQTIPANAWTRIAWTFTTQSNDRTGYIRIDNNGSSEEGTAAVLRVANLKLEKGNRATDWTPAPEDLEDRVETAESKIIQNENSIASLVTRTTNVENKFSGYSTTEEMRTAIEQTENSIKSSVSETYTTKTEFGSLEIGGRNLIAGTSETREYVGNINNGNGTYYDVWGGKTINVANATEYIVSFDAKADDEQSIRCHFYSPNTTTKALSSTGQSSSNGDGHCDVNITTEWKRYWVKWTQNPADSQKSVIVGRNFTENNVYIRKVKLETGHTPTDWSVAPEDMASMDEIESIHSSSNLIETRVTTVESLISQLSDCISMLVTDGNGESLMTQTESGWTFSTGEIQDIVDSTSENLDNLTNEMNDVNSAVEVLQRGLNDLGILSDYIKIGTYENEPCIELGEIDSDFKLLITNTRIMFMEGSDIPAYINNQSLHIKKAVIEEEFQQGGFVWKVRNNGNMGLVWKGVTN